MRTGTVTVSAARIIACGVMVLITASMAFGDVVVDMPPPPAKVATTAASSGQSSASSAATVAVGDVALARFAGARRRPFGTYTHGRRPYTGTAYPPGYTYSSWYPHGWGCGPYQTGWAWGSGHYGGGYTFRVTGSRP